MLREELRAAAIRPSYVFNLLFRNQLGQQRITLSRGLQRFFPRAGEFVVLTWWPLLSIRNRLAFPMGSNQFIAFHPAQCRVNSSARKAGKLHHRVAINMAFFCWL